MPARRQIAILASVLVGIVVGALIAAFERITDEVLLDAVLHAPLWQQMLAPVVGLIISAAALRWVGGGASPATADEYVGNFHERRRVLPLRPVLGRLIAGGATVGMGGAMGLEGPAIYTGAVTGSQIQKRLRSFFSRDDAKALLVAGAAAGVAAVFKAPATGVIFALEVPYTDDIARRALIPSLLASASSYLVFVSLTGSTSPIFPPFGTVPGFELPELGGALAIGLLAGGGARLFSMGVAAVKNLTTTQRLLYRLPVAGAIIVGVIALTDAVLGDARLALGPGYRTVEWIGDPSRGLELVALFLVLRAVATLASLGGGGAGGLFIPLAVLGLLLGRFVAGVVGEPASALFPFIGLAAFLGAGYRTPMASVMFVAESTGRANFVVPALIAAAASQLVMGRWSVSTRQQSVRSGHLERRFQLPITTALTTDTVTVGPESTLSEFVWVHALGNRERTVCVVAEDGSYVGMCDLDDVNEVPREHWETTTIEPIVRTDLPTGTRAWTLRDAIAAMEDNDMDRLAVCDGDGRFVGLVLLAEILKLDEILDETSG